MNVCHIVKKKKKNIWHISCVIMFKIRLFVVRQKAQRQMCLINTSSMLTRAEEEVEIVILKKIIINQ